MMGRIMWQSAAMMAVIVVLGRMLSVNIVMGQLVFATRTRPAFAQVGFTFIRKVLYIAINPPIFGAILN